MQLVTILDVLVASVDFSHIGRDIFSIFGGVRCFCLGKVFCNIFCFLVEVIGQFVLGPVGYPAKIHYTAIFASAI